jgi:hypothetical protein
VTRQLGWSRVTGVITVVVALCVGMGTTAASGASTRDAATAPTLTHITLSARRLASTGGKITVSAHVHRTARCTLRARPVISRLPLVKSCRAKTVRWQVRFPANTGTTARTYQLTIVARGVQHQLTTKVRTVTVAPVPPPRISAVTQTASQLGSTGGTVRFHAAVANARRCVLAVTPAVLGLPNSQSCTGNSAAWTLTLPPNPVDSPASYQFSVTAFGANGTEVTKQSAVTVAAQTPTCPGQTVTTTPTTSAYFNDPTTDSVPDQDAVVTAMINTICSVSPPVNGVASTIDLAMFEYELDDVTQALLWAHQYRSAAVHVALDGENGEMAAADGSIGPNPAYADLLNGLPAGSVVLCGPNAGTVPLPPPGGDAMRRRQAVSAAASSTSSGAIGTACAGDNILHDKLLVVSSVDTAHDSAVFTGAQNLAVHGEVDGFNNALQIVGSASIYNQNVTYFQHIFANTRSPALGDTLASSPITTPAGTITDAFAPRNSPAAFPTSNAYVAANDLATDTTANLLDKVSCSSPGNFAGDHSGAQARTTVQIAMYAYNSRPRITSQLEALEKQGCEVQVLYTNMSAATLSALQTAGIQPLQLSDDTYEYPDGSGTIRVFIHDKYVLISGAITTGARTLSNQDILLTGSENFTQPAIHQNDEQTMAVQQTATAATGTTPLYDDYEANWTHIASVIAALPPPTP